MKVLPNASSISLILHTYCFVSCSESHQSACNVMYCSCIGYLVVCH